MAEIFNGGLDVSRLLESWRASIVSKNLGAFVAFAGIVRAENGVSALSFDIYEPLLAKWFDNWQKKARAKGAILFMAHSRGDVKIAESSFAAAIASAKRRAALELIDVFVEDFKQNAPIWKYDVINGKRVFALDRAFSLPHSGVLARANGDNSGFGGF
ncbi:MAG: molybdenum cofactor biosynthesis protein MoaE [Helicobacteraceae bacterium]|jgi:molybdopterin synthase catalytic subunit|nr:molybdenum cofactor biosynthesis protein MoaE [Helicobacteraceae bacterium]